MVLNAPMRRACWLISVFLPSASAFALLQPQAACTTRWAARYTALPGHDGMPQAFNLWRALRGGCSGSSRVGPGRTAVGARAKGAGPSMTSGSNAEVPRDEMMVQYVLVRRDLQSSLGWPLGSVVAQGCHAVSALLWEMRDDDNVAQYCATIDSMHKVVLGVKDSKELLKFAQKLTDAGFRHRVWVEQPENDPTALAVLPYPRGQIQPILKKLPLLK